MTKFAFVLLLLILAMGIVSVFKRYSDKDKKMAFISAVETMMTLTVFSYFFIKIGALPDFIGVEEFETKVLSIASEKKQTEITEVFAAKKVYRDGDNAIIEDDGGYKIVVNLYNIKDKNKFVKTKIFKSKDGAIKKVEIVLEDNKHKKDFEVNY